MKAHIFIDFWNFQLSIREIDSQYRIDWKKISPWLLDQAQQILNQGLSFEGTHIYISYNPTSSKDKNLRDFALNTLSRFPGIQVNLVERKARKAQMCPNCHRPILRCPMCNEEIKKTIEKGVDTAIVTDMIKFAWEGSLEVAILISSDRDYIPLIELLTNKGYKVINGYFPPSGSHLASKCWANIDLKSGLTLFSL